MKSKKKKLFVFILITIFLLTMNSCSSKFKNNNDLVDQRIPDFQGKSLSGKRLSIPSGLKRPTVLLIGYVQRAQFDADRWLYGLLSNEFSTMCDIYEVPTIKGYLPRLMSHWIDSGMRSGIPQEDWSSVVTVYSDASDIVEFTGNENPSRIRAILIDSSGVVHWFHDRGFSAGALISLKQCLRKM